MPCGSDAVRRRAGPRDSGRAEAPDEAIVGLNPRRQWHDVYRINLVTGERTILLQHDRFLEVTVDDDYRVRYAVQMTLDGGLDLYLPSGDDWQLWDTIPAEDMLTTSLRLR